VRDVVRSRRQFDRVIDGYTRRAKLSPFEAWALEAAKERRALLGRAEMVLAQLPDLTVQVVHGDLAAPNLLLCADDVTAIVDFQPAGPRFLAWEIARIGCDPRTLQLGDEWIDGLGELLASYREAHPAVRLDDLLSTAAVGCAYTLGSTFPLAEPPDALTPSLELYARARHETALTMLDRLADVNDSLHDRLTWT
jgi:homoserine kinase type II